jgi:hypothetical protein
LKSWLTSSFWQVSLLLHFEELAYIFLLKSYLPHIFCRVNCFLHIEVFTTILNECVMIWNICQIGNGEIQYVNVNHLNFSYKTYFIDENRCKFVYYKHVEGMFFLWKYLIKDRYQSKACQKCCLCTYFLDHVNILYIKLLSTNIQYIFFSPPMRFQFFIHRTSITIDMWECITNYMWGSITNYMWEKRCFSFVIKPFIVLNTLILIIIAS